jgi:hypothetical protein
VYPTYTLNDRNLSLSRPTLPRAKTITFILIALTGRKPSHTTGPLWVVKHNFSSIAVVAAKYYFTAERKKSFV